MILLAVYALTLTGSVAFGKLEKLIAAGIKDMSVREDRDDGAVVA